MQKSVYKKKGNFKGLLFVLGLLLIAAILIYTQHQVDLLQKNSREYLQFRVRVMEDYLKNPNSDIDYNFFLTEVIQGTDYPIIITVNFISAVLVLAGTFISDVLYMVVDPRIRL